MTHLDPAQVGPLPRGVRLLHVGPHKTGTTALQSAFDAARESLAEQGVHYAGRSLQPSAPVTALRARRPLRGERPAQEGAWDDLVAEIRGAGDRRVVISSEYFADLDDDLARRVVHEIGADRVHVLVTVRPLTRIAPSQWQQYVQNGHTTDYERWLGLVLDDPPHEQVGRRFWHRHRHDLLVARWAGAVGADRLTVLVVDERDRSVLPRTVEQMLDLRSGTLVPRADRTNRGLTRPEVEVVRRLNRIARRESWSDGDYAHVVRNGVARTLKLVRPDSGDEPMRSPAWADESLRAIGVRVAGGLEASSVRVVGDVDGLARRPRVAAASGSRLLQVDHAAAAVAGAVMATGVGPLATRELDRVPTRLLVSALVRRSLAWGRREARLRRARRAAS